MPTAVNSSNRPRPTPSGSQATALGGAGYVNQNLNRRPGLLGPFRGIASGDFWSPINLSQGLSILPGRLGSYSSMASHLLGGSAVMGAPAGPTASDSGVGVGLAQGLPPGVDPFALAIQQAFERNKQMKAAGRPSGIAGENYVNKDWLANSTIFGGPNDRYIGLPGTDLKLNGGERISRELADAINASYAKQRGINPPAAQSYRPIGPPPTLKGTAVAQTPSTPAVYSSGGAPAQKQQDPLVRAMMARPGIARGGR